MFLRIILTISVLLLWAPDGARGQAHQAPATEVAANTGGAAEKVCQATLDWLDRAPKMVDALVPLAEKAAEKLAAGGMLYVAGNAGFGEEMFYRAGGFPFTKVWRGENLKSNDVLLVGRYRPNDATPRYAKLSYLGSSRGRRLGKGMVIHISSHRWPQISRIVKMMGKDPMEGRLHLIDTGAPHGATMADLAVGQLSTTALAWALHGEIISAATRAGKTLATFASDWEPDGRAWDATVKDSHLHPKYSLAPIEAGKIAGQYLRICRSQIADFKSTQCGQVRIAARRIAANQARGGVVWMLTQGHIHTDGNFVPPELSNIAMFGRSYDWRRYSRKIPAGDMVLWMGYLRYPSAQIDAVLERGCEAVVFCCDPGKTTDKLTSIGSCWKNFDTVIDLEGYPIRVLPSSGTVQTPQWYALMAETLAVRKAN